MPWVSCGADAGEALPLDTQYRWAQERYSRRRRALDIWSSLAVLRTRLWLLDQKCVTFIIAGASMPLVIHSPQGAAMRTFWISACPAAVTGDIGVLTTGVILR